MKQRRAFFYLGRVGGVLVLRIRRLVLEIKWRRELPVPVANPRRARLMCAAGLIRA
jgi:hypothetical protein